MELKTAGGVILEGEAAQQHVETLAMEYARQMVNAQDVPVSWATRRTATPVGLGTGPTAQQLLNEQRGWPQVGNRATMDRIAGIQWFAAERFFDSEKGKFAYEPLPEHPLNRTLERPNPYMSGRKMRMLIAGLVQHTGAAYLQKIRDPFGVPVELWFIPTQLIEPVSADGNLIGAYRVMTADGGTVALPVEDVVRIWRPDLRTIYGQLGVLGPQGLEYDALKFMTEHLRAHFQFDGTPRVALKAETGAVPPEPDDRRKFLTAWRRSHNRRTGSDIGLPAFVPEGFGIHEFNVDEIDEGMSEFEDRWARQILAAAGIPRFAVGIDTNVNRATAETTMWAWDQNANEPLTGLIADDMTTQLAQPDYFQELAVQFEKFVATDKEFEREVEDQDLRLGVRSVNQVRAGRDMDEVSWGDLPRAAFSEQPYTGEEDDGTESVNDLRSAEPRKSGPRNRADAADFFAPDASWARYMRAEKRFLGRYGSAQLRVWEAQRLDSQRRLAETAEASAEDLRAILDGNARERRAAKRRSPTLTMARTINVSDIFMTGVWQELYVEEVGPVRSDVLIDASEAVTDVLNPDTTFVLDGFVESELRTSGAQYVRNVDGTTQRRLAAMLAESQSLGESVDQMAKRMDSIFMDRKRARTVARTEVGSANQLGTLHGYELSGAVEGKQWNNSRDGAVRDSHQIDGQMVPMGSDFSLRSGAGAQHPLDPKLPAEDKINCRCFMTPVLMNEPA